jgi:hypothetical protein
MYKGIMKDLVLNSLDKFSDVFWRVYSKVVTTGVTTLILLYVIFGGELKIHINFDTAIVLWSILMEMVEESDMIKIILIQ